MNLDYLKNKKDELGMTYEEIANASGVSLSSIQKIFSGQNTKPRSSTLISIERALDEMHEDRHYGSPGVREVSIGNQDFKTIIENKYFYIDKTDFIREWWESGDIVTLITRPRRFGKTLNISMLDYFFSNQHTDSAKLFKSLDIWKYESFRKLQGKYPVIYLSFAAVKGNYYEMARQQIIQEIVDAYGRVEDVI
ncbi:MAG: AAA family ATPase [Eubacterium sp.]|nr:AAA family ATPase [Eubacterium sp.]